MPIRVETTGAAELYGGLARLAGESIAAQKEMERAERNAQALREHQWEMERRQLEHQWNIEAFNRSQSWEIEKAEQASKLDFAREEKERQDTLDEYSVKKKAIMDSDILSDNEKQMWVLQLDTKLPLAATYMKPTKTTFTPGQIQRGIGDLTKYEGIFDRPQIIQKAKEAFGEDFETTAPEVMNYINQKFPEGLPPTTEMPTPYTGPAPAGGGVSDWIKQMYYGPQYYERTRPTAPVTTTPTTYPALGTEGEVPLLRGEQVPEEYRRMGVTEYRPPTMENYRSIVAGQLAGTTVTIPTPKSKAEYDLLRSGSQYYKDGRIYIKR